MQELGVQARHVYDGLKELKPSSSNDLWVATIEPTKFCLQQWIIIKNTTHIAEQTVCTMPSDKYGIW